MELKNKKGSQVGIVMSFTIFIISLIFIFTLISPPVSVDKSKLYSMEVLERNVRNNISENIGLILLSQGSEDLEDCLSFSTSELDFNYNYFIVKDYLSQEVASGGSVSGTIYFDKTGNNNLFNVYFSNHEFNRELETSNTGCDSAKVYSVLEKEIIIQENIEKLILNYQTNYSETKEYIGISNADEFNVFFIYENGTKIGTEKDKLNTNIFAKTIQLQYLDNKANEKVGELILKIW
jgi:hypothetical protein